MNSLLLQILRLLFPRTMRQFAHSAVTKSQLRAATLDFQGSEQLAQSVLQQWAGRKVIVIRDNMREPLFGVVGSDFASVDPDMDSACFPVIDVLTGTKSYVFLTSLIPADPIMVDLVVSLPPSSLWNLRTTGLWKNVWALPSEQEHDPVGLRERLVKADFIHPSPKLRALSSEPKPSAEGCVEKGYLL